MGSIYNTKTQFITLFGIRADVVRHLTLLAKQQGLKSDITQLANELESDVKVISKIENTIANINFRIADIKIQVREIKKQDPSSNSNNNKTFFKLEQDYWQLVTDKNSLDATLKNLDLYKVVQEKQRNLTILEASLHHVTAALGTAGINFQSDNIFAESSSSSTYAKNPI